MNKVEVTACPTWAYVFLIGDNETQCDGIIIGEGATKQEAIEGAIEDLENALRDLRAQQT